MKLVALHGPAINDSRKHLFEIKSKFSNENIVVFESGSTVSEIFGSIMTVSLTPEPRLFILENPSEDLTFLTPAFGSPRFGEAGEARLWRLDSSDSTLVLWFDHTLNAKKPISDWIKKSKGEIIFFEEGKVSIFPFLDYLANKDYKAYLEIKKLKSGGFDIFYFLTMTFYLLRNLVLTPKNAPEFVKQKLERQRKNFTREKIIEIYRNTLEIDFKLKSGLLDQNQAEFLLVNMFMG